MTVGIYTVASSFLANTAQLGLNAASKTDWGLFENRDYSSKVFYSGSDQDSAFGEVNELCFMMSNQAI